MSRLARGEAPEDAIDDRLLAEHAIAGTPVECLAQAEAYAEAGVTELAIAPIGERPADDTARLGSSIK
jgi:alkanesulfonate monooxygenase SsuD/methylene tetrahydromethanopterin reductase-like flavin-dependent oxidoreductase (luciferase family)